ncbi:MAG: arginyltransferase [Myxococcota bacterium]
MSRRKFTAVLQRGNPDELLVYDEEEACPYLEGETARLPMRLPLRPLSNEEVDDRLSRGDRRHGRFLYRPQCPTCRACQPIRVDVAAFTMSRNQRRHFARAEAVLRTEIAKPICDARHLELYELHKWKRGLAGPNTRPLTAQGYAGFLVDRCGDSFELQYYLDDTLVGVAVTDSGHHALSAVYCYYDPAHAKLGIGTYSVLKQLELCKRWNLRYLYLGLFIEANPHMSYKQRFRPHERLIDGRWQPFA